MYVDTSVLVKLFVREPDSDYYGRLLDGAALCSSVLAYTELWSALLAKERQAGLPARQRREACGLFEQYVSEAIIDLRPLGPAIFKRANLLLQRCHPRVPLRSLDALHLACADQTQDWPLVTHDRRMREAAELLGYPLSPLP
jgi:predicted nucleic acid-binding protein